jgi:hypothetical protein
MESYPSLLIAIPTYDGKLLANVTTELLQLLDYAKSNDMDIGFTYLANCALVDIVRNTLANTFLASEYQKVLMIDSDIDFKWRDVMQLLHMSKTHAVVGATYPSRIELAEPKHRFYVKPYKPEGSFTEDGLMEIMGMGAGFLMIDREVFEKLKPVVEVYPGGMVNEGVVAPRSPHHNFFPVGVKDGHHHGEDHGFLNLCVDNGIIPVLDYSIELGHVGTKVFRASPREALQQAGLLKFNSSQD